MNMRIGRHRAALVVLSFLVLVFTLAGRLVGDEGQRERTYNDLTTFTEVLHLVDTSYVDAVTEENLMAGAFRGMLASLDPHSGWLSPEETRDVLAAEDGRIDAGVETTKRSGYAYVVRIMPGGPADKAGVKVGEYIRAIAGRTTREMSDLQVRHLLTGSPDTLIHLNLFGDHEGREVELELVPYELEPVDATLDPGGVLVVTARRLGPGTVKALDHLLRRPPEGTEKVLLDLRNVVGGQEDDAVAFSDLFLDEGVIVRVDERGQEERVLSARAGTVWDGPLALLVNHLSAGPAEIIAAALGRNGRAELLGERTFGDASLQRLIRLPDDSSIILSVGHYLGPKGVTWHKEGLVPDVPIGDEKDEIAAEGETDERSPLARSEEQLQRAVQYLLDQGAVEKAA
ncbi:MAG: S41 family peptidase [Acidobacteria bacterium]|nr:S41 family peptidase [Acidobacteriota bacterium]